MNGSTVLRTALNLSAAAALLCGCGGPQPPIAATGSGSQVSPLSGDDRVDKLPHHKTFRYIGQRQRFKVPAHVKTLTVVALGAAGAAAGTTSSGRSNDYFGRGGRVYAVIPVTPGETLTVVVGGQGSSLGGYNGGGKPGGPGNYGPCYGGGGASDVRENGRSINDRILVAAGGAGQGCGFDSASAVFGGSGGPTDGQDGGGLYGAGGGSGGKQRAGGAGGPGGPGYYGGHGGSGHSGKFGRGGAGGNGGLDPYYNRSNYKCAGGGGGGGGGGYYGGGGGGGGYNYQSFGGGGGSSYVEPAAQRLRMWRGWKTATGNGLVVFSW